MEVVIGALVLLSIVLFVITVKQGKIIKQLERTNGVLQKSYDNQTRLLQKAQLNLSECKAELESANKIYITKGMV
nr:unknown function [Klebsiella phage vB_Kpn_K30lambda2.2]